MNKTYYAKKFILAATDVAVESGGECTFIAGDEIELSNGFEVKKGGEFEARVYKNKMIE